MGKLLRYLVAQAVQGHVRGTTEYAIGLEVLGRDPSSYSPGEDPTVRVQVGRLRQRLETYARTCAQLGDVVIRIPLGSYMPVIERLDAAPPAPPPPGRANPLTIQPVQFIAGKAAGRAFAQGLQEELLSQLVQAFGPVVLGEAAQQDQPRVVISTLRVDADRIRVSVRLLEVPQHRVTWARQFDQAPGFGIQEQEALASTICSALKLHLQG
ncbi:MAG: hypothetical protein EKK53_12670 [Burkholderiales bacterium]|nr:MAG: hypothetical protein EKK53_12670 [Burkholderiales bacterium]